MEATNERPRIINSEKKTEDRQENQLRPKSLNNFTGQKKIKRNLKVYIEAAKLRKENIEHILLYGPPGLGKTTLASIISNEMNVNLKITSGPAIERPGDLAAILTNLEPNDILFIDEIHRLNRLVEEVLYPAMEDFELDIVIGKGPSARSIRIDLDPFTLIGATTRIGLLSAPLRDRFGIVERLEFYQPEDLEKIIDRAATILKSNIDKEACYTLAKRSRGTPRIANRLLKRVRDWAQVNHNGTITKTIVNDSLNNIEVDKIGLDSLDRNYLTTIIQKFNGGPVGVDTIAASIAEDSTTLEDMVEPYLLQLGFIKRTPRGREITLAACNHLKLEHPQNQKMAQNLLF